MHLGMKKKGKRKKTQAGHTSEIDGDPASRAGKRGPLAFTLERLLSLYSQISIISETSAIGSNRKRLHLREEVSIFYM